MFLSVFKIGERQIAFGGGSSGGGSTAPTTDGLSGSPQSSEGPSGTTSSRGGLSGPPRRTEDPIAAFTAPPPLPPLAPMTSAQGASSGVMAPPGLSVAPSFGSFSPSGSQFAFEDYLRRLNMPPAGVPPIQPLALSPMDLQRGIGALPLTGRKP